MIKILTLLGISLSLISAPVIAHGPTPQKVDEEIIINADVMTVWNKVKAFDQLAEWHPLVAAVDMQDETTRIVTLKSGGEITDSLDETDMERHYMSYRLLQENTSIFPVSFYTIGIEVQAIEDGTVVKWGGRFYRAETGNFPPDNLNDAAAVKVMTEYATTGLSGLKSTLEK